MGLRGASVRRQRKHAAAEQVMLVASLLKLHSLLEMIHEQRPRVGAPRVINRLVRVIARVPADIDGCAAS